MDLDSKTTSERMLITVRTYPNISSQYIETVCTGAITEGGEWRRLYPVPLRYLNKDQQYRTWDIIKVPCHMGKDTRPETRSPDNQQIQIVGHIKSWDDRVRWVEPTCVKSMAEMVKTGRTLAPVQVSEVIEFQAKKKSGNSAKWTPAEKEKLKQAMLFDERKPLEKIPYEFRFVWRDGEGEQHNSLIVAWEFGETWRQYRTRYANPIEEMRAAFIDKVCGPKRRVYFFMGNIARRPKVFMVCGIFNPPSGVRADEQLW